jgi:hypothetical protein
MLIGSLMYAMVCTRPDISFAIGKLSCFNNCFTKEHYEYAKRVLKYLKGTIKYGLHYAKTSIGLEGFADADWANDKLDRKSCSGFLLKLAGGAVCWESRKQTMVALSTTEAEYVSLSICTKRAIVLYKIVSEILGARGYRELFNINTVCIFNDNQSAVKNANCKDVRERSKHIDIRYHFVKEAVEQGLVTVVYMSTENMLADILTKPLVKSKHHTFFQGLNLLNW